MDRWRPLRSKKHAGLRAIEFTDQISLASFLLSMSKRWQAAAPTWREIGAQRSGVGVIRLHDVVLSSTSFSTPFLFRLAH
jgi:hypothetical protein